MDSRFGGSGGSPDTLWMGEIGPDANEDTIHSAFSQQGSEYRVKFIRMGPRHDNGLKGYCFITFDSPETMEKALTNLQSRVIYGLPGLTTFKLNYATRKGDRFRDGDRGGFGGGQRGGFGGGGDRGGFHNRDGHAGWNGPNDNRTWTDHYEQNERRPFRARSQFAVYVGNLGLDVDDASIYELFARKCPETVISTHSFLDSMWAKRYGFVNFTDGSEIEKALELNGCPELAHADYATLRVYRTNNDRRPDQQQHTGQGQGETQWSSGGGYGYGDSSSQSSGGGGGGPGSWGGGNWNQSWDAWNTSSDSTGSAAAAS